MGGHRSSAEGASIEAPQAPRGVEFWGGGVPLPNGRRVSGGGSAPSPKKFFTFLLGIVHFGAYSDTISHVHKAYSRLKEKQNPTIK